MTLNILYVPIGHLYIFFCDVCVNILVIFELGYFFCLINCKSSFVCLFLDTRTLPNITFVNISSQSGECSLTLHILTGIFLKSETFHFD